MECERWWEWEGELEGGGRVVVRKIGEEGGEL